MRTDVSAESGHNKRLKQVAGALRHRAPETVGPRPPLLSHGVRRRGVEFERRLFGNVPMPGTDRRALGVGRRPNSSTSLRLRRP